MGPGPKRQNYFGEFNKYSKILAFARHGVVQGQKVFWCARYQLGRHTPGFDAAFHSWRSRAVALFFTSYSPWPLGVRLLPRVACSGGASDVMH